MREVRELRESILKLLKLLKLLTFPIAPKNSPRTGLERRSRRADTTDSEALVRSA